MNPTLQKVKNTIQTCGMLSGQDVVVGLSGGADSVCLLLMLAALAGTEKLHAVHVNHGLRESAAQDEKYVRDLCRELSVPLSVHHVDAAGYAKEHGLGIEEAGHLLRRDLFLREADAISPDCCIALAHHSEDQAETVLFHLCRGSGLRGLAGMRPKQGRWIRPLLYLTRQEIEDYLKSENRTWCTDETNQDPFFARNRIRLSILPEMTEYLNAGTTAHLCEIADEAAETEDYLEAETKKALAACTKRPGVLDVPALLALPSLLQDRVLFETLSLAAGRRKDLTRAHVRAIASLAGKQGNGQLSLPYGVTCRKSYDLLIFEKDGEKTSTAPETGIVLPRSEADYHPQVFAFSHDLSKVPREKYTKWLDYDRIRPFLEYRTRQPQDEMHVFADGRTKKLSRILIDMKIPEELRKVLVLPAVGREILWVPGGPMSLQYQVSEQTRTVLCLSVRQD